MSLKNQFNKLSNYHLIKLIKQIVAINKIIMNEIKDDVDDEFMDNLADYVLMIAKMKPSKKLMHKKKQIIVILAIHALICKLYNDSKILIILIMKFNTLVTF